MIPPLKTCPNCLKPQGEMDARGNLGMKIPVMGERDISPKRKDRWCNNCGYNWIVLDK